MQSDGLNSALSPVVYGDIAPSIKINTQIYRNTHITPVLHHFLQMNDKLHNGN